MLLLLGGLLQAQLLQPCAGGFVLASSITDKAIYAARLLTAIEQARGDGMSASQLTTPGQFNDPRGIAVDNLGGHLYVVDKGTSELLSLKLSVRGGGSALATGPPVSVMSGVSGDWVTVDNAGNVFFEANGALCSLPKEKLFLAWDAANKVEVIYDMANTTELNTPQGLASDGFRIFWANGANGVQDGSIVRGFGTASAANALSVTKLASNEDASQGICLSSQKLFFTAQEQKVYSTLVNGGAATVISDALGKPRGCAFDGDGTVFLADELDGKLYSFAAGGSSGSMKAMRPAVEIPGAFGVAIFHDAAAKMAFSQLAGLLVALLALALHTP